MAIAATNSATPSLQATLSQARLEQAKRDMQSAQTKVEALQRETAQAEQEVQVRRANVQALGSHATLQDSTYMGQLRAARSAVAPATQDFLVRMYAATSAKFASSGNALRSGVNGQVFTNTLGQPTGRIVDLRI
ncbi:MAG: hypothetical protein QE265_02365 [Rhodoferax sp.]|nr:hypothetical protein [Rhodoferax sp.]